jgi:hypothetical protein
MNTSLHWDRQDLADYFLDVLPPADCRELEIHLAECETCAAQAIRMHESWETLEREMSPAALAATIRESVWQGLIDALAAGAGNLAGRSDEWVQKMKDQAGRLSSAILFPAPFQPLPTLGPHPETEPASPSRPVMIIGPAGFPEPVIWMADKGRELIVEFPQVASQALPEVFLVCTTEAFPPQRLGLQRGQSGWRWRGPAPQYEYVLVVGVPF